MGRPRKTGRRRTTSGGRCRGVRRTSKYTCGRIDSPVNPKMDEIYWPNYQPSTHVVVRKQGYDDQQSSGLSRGPQPHRTTTPINTNYVYTYSK